MTKTELIDQRALDILRASKVGLCPVDIGTVVRFCRIELRFDDLEEDVSGILIVKLPDTRTIVVNSNHSLIRRRFTIAYILGRFKSLPLTEDVLIVFTKIYQFTCASSIIDSSMMVGTDEPDHVDALKFASAILLPEPDVRNRTFTEYNWDENAIISLARQYEVSEVAMVRRMFALDIIKPRA